MNLKPWRPKQTASSLTQFRKELDDLWSRFLEPSGEGWFESHLPEAFTRRGFPSVNVKENTDTVTLTVDLPGVEPKDVDVEVVGDELVISGERKWEAKDEEQEFVRMESQYGSFRRVIPLPAGLRTDADDVDAKFKNGLLTIRLKKVEPTPSRKVSVKSA